MKNKTNINGLWRFYDEANNISGIVVGNNAKIATINARVYIMEYFNNITEKSPNVCVWRVEDDDDYHCDYAIATNY